MGASFLKVPQLELEPEEAEKLAKAIVEVTEQYDYVPMLDPKTQAWIQLGMVASTIYGPRVASAMMDKQTAKRERAARPTPRNVTNMGVVEMPQAEAV